MANIISSYLKYKAWLDQQTWISPALRQGMLASQASSMASSNVRSGRISSLLGNLGAPIATNPGYQAAANEIAAIKAKHTGLTAQNAIAASINKWTAHGLNPATLAQVAQAAV